MYTIAGVMASLAAMASRGEFSSASNHQASERASERACSEAHDLLK